MRPDFSTETVLLYGSSSALLDTLVLQEHPSPVSVFRFLLYPCREQLSENEAWQDVEFARRHSNFREIFPLVILATAADESLEERASSHDANRYAQTTKIREKCPSADNETGIKHRRRD